MEKIENRIQLMEEEIIALNHDLDQLYNELDSKDREMILLDKKIEELTDTS